MHIRLGSAFCLALRGGFEAMVERAKGGVLCLAFQIITHHRGIWESRTLPDPYLPLLKAQWPGEHFPAGQLFTYTSRRFSEPQWLVCAVLTVLLTGELV